MRLPYAGRPALKSALILFWPAALLALAGACGIKAPPRPPRQPGLPAIRSLKADLENGAVRLQWRQPQNAAQAAGYNVYRAVSDPAAEACPGCPMLFEKIGRLDRSGASDPLTFSDPVAPGLSYHYKVVPVHASGARGPDSNLVTVQVPAQ